MRLGGNVGENHNGMKIFSPLFLFLGPFNVVLCWAKVGKGHLEGNKLHLIKNTHSHSMILVSSRSHNCTGEMLLGNNRNLVCSRLLSPKSAKHTTQCGRK